MSLKTKMLGGTPFSQMSLGTVQLGMNYGIANQEGKPDLERSMSVLQAAVDGGVTALDTAAVYGDSEKVIGEFLKRRGGRKGLFITTKFLLDVPDDAPDVQVRSEIRRSFERSLENLGVDGVDCLMLHRTEYFAKFGDAVAGVLEELIQEELVGRAGVSIYHPEDLEPAMRYGLVSMVQAPMSLMDHALAESKYMQVLREKDIALIVRSVFLQGLFFLDPDKMTDPDLLEAAAPKLRLIREIAREAKMTAAQLAVAYIRDMPGVTGVVLGAEKPEQVRENLAHFGADAPSIDAQTRQRIDRECSADIARIMTVLSRPKLAN